MPIRRRPRALATLALGTALLLGAGCCQREIPIYNEHGVVVGYQESHCHSAEVAGHIAGEIIFGVFELALRSAVAACD